jgi:integrase
MATITKRSNGKWQAKVRRHGMPPLSKVFRRRIDADSWAKTQESEFDRGVWKDRTTADATTLYTLLDAYLREVVPPKRGADVEVFRIRTMQRDDLSRYKLSALTPIVLTGWRDQRLGAGAAGSTVNRELGLLSAVLNWGRKELMVQMDNPVAAIRRPPQGRARDRRFEGGEEKRLLQALSDHPGTVQGRRRAGRYRVGTRNPWIRPLVELAIATAMRRGELLSLTWDDIDFDRRTAHLEHTKNGDARVVPLSSRALKILKGLPKSKDGQVFPVTIDSVKKAWERACQRAGLEDFHFHDLRHVATARLSEKLPNLIELAAVTGHKDLRMLKRYYNPKPEDLARILG